MTRNFGKQAALRKRREAARRNATFMKLLAWRTMNERIRVDVFGSSGSKAFDVALRPNRRRNFCRELCGCKDEFLEPRRLYPSRKIAELNARFKEQFLNERLEVCECKSGKGFHVLRPKFATCASEVRGEREPFDAFDSLFQDDSLDEEFGSGKKICECKTGQGKPKMLYALRSDAAREARRCERLFGKRVFVCKCPSGGGFHLSYWLPKWEAENSGEAPGNICECKDEGGKPAELFWNRNFAEEIARERPLGGGKRLEVFECPSGGGFHLGNEEGGFKNREMRRESESDSGAFGSLLQDDPFGDAFGSSEKSCANEGCERGCFKPEEKPKNEKLGEDDE